MTGGMGRLYAVQLRTGIVGRTGLARMRRAARFGLGQATLIVSADTPDRARAAAFDYDRGRNGAVSVNHPGSGLAVIFPAPRW